MAGSTLDPDNLAGVPPPKVPEGHHTRALGPSDSSDSGSDVSGPDAGRELGDSNLDAGSDRFGTGERRTVGTQPDTREDADQELDRIVDATEAGLGGGLDQAEEARRGKTRYGKLDTGKSG